MAGTGGQQQHGTSVAFLTQLREKHPGPLRVIWDNAPAHRGEAVREYLRTPELGLRLVNPRFHEGRLCRATARTSTPLRLSGAGRERRPLAICAWAAGRRCRACPCVGRGEGRQIPGRAVQPERRGETALPDGPAIQGRNAPARLPPRFPAPGKCTSHLGCGLGGQRRGQVLLEVHAGPGGLPGGLGQRAQQAGPGADNCFHSDGCPGPSGGARLHPSSNATDKAPQPGTPRIHCGEMTTWRVSGGALPRASLSM